MGDHAGDPGAARPDSLAALTLRVRAFSEARNWGQFHSPKNLSMALIVEAAELVEHFQWLTAEASHALPAAKQAAVSAEIADIFLYLLRLADVLGVDILTAAAAKIDKNEDRYPATRVWGDPRRADEYE
jgi:NTP pyrophosphatase (non-canonical NTP hydrolase)